MPRQPSSRRAIQPGAELAQPETEQTVAGMGRFGQRSGARPRRRHRPGRLLGAQTEHEQTGPGQRQQQPLLMGRLAHLAVLPVPALALVLAKGHLDPEAPRVATQHAPARGQTGQDHQRFAARPLHDGLHRRAIAGPVVQTRIGQGAPRPTPRAGLLGVAQPHRPQFPRHTAQRALFAGQDAHHQRRQAAHTGDARLRVGKARDLVFDLLVESGRCGHRGLRGYGLVGQPHQYPEALRWPHLCSPKTVLP